VVVVVVVVEAVEAEVGVVAICYQPFAEVQS
jgi:hypothetical protein